MMTSMLLSNAKYCSFALSPLRLTYSSLSWSLSVSVVYSVSVFHLQTFTSPAFFYVLSLFPFLKFSHFLSSHAPVSHFSTACSSTSLGEQRMQWPPSSLTQVATARLHGCPVTPEGGAGVVWELFGEGGRGCRRHQLNGTANIGLTGEWTGGCPLAFGHVTAAAALVAKHERRRDMCVCVCCMDDIPRSLWGHMSVVETEWERGVVMAARSISFVFRQKRNGDIYLQQQPMPPSAYSSALSDALFLISWRTESNMYQRSYFSCIEIELARLHTQRIGQKYWCILIRAMGQTQLNHSLIIRGYWIQRRKNGMNMENKSNETLWVWVWMNMSM